MRGPGRPRKMDQDEAGGRAITHTYGGLMDEFPGAFTYKNSAAAAAASASAASIVGVVLVLLITLVFVVVLVMLAGCS